MNTSVTSGYLSLFHLDLLPVNQFSRLLKSLGTLSAIAGCGCRAIGNGGAGAETTQSDTKSPEFNNRFDNGA